MKTILIVDDEYALVENLTELLQDEGYRIVSAANGKDGLERVTAEKPDLVLTDLMMPIGDGRELVRGMRALADFRATPVVMMSGSTKASALSNPNGGAVEVSAFLRKPVSWDKLLDVVVRLIGEGEKAAPTSAV
jgi:CheY-like chemotaxis protein